MLCVCWCFNLWFTRYVLLLWLVWFALVVSGGCLVTAGYYTVACCGLWALVVMLFCCCEGVGWGIGLA